jgi:hypothetical protein
MLDSGLPDPVPSPTGLVTQAHASAWLRILLGMGEEGGGPI